MRKKQLIKVRTSNPAQDLLNLFDVEGYWMEGDIVTSSCGFKKWRLFLNEGIAYRLR